MSRVKYVPPTEERWQCPRCGNPVAEMQMQPESTIILLEPCGHYTKATLLNETGEWGDRRGD